MLRFRFGPGPRLTGRVMVRVAVGPDGQLMSQKISQSSLSESEDALRSTPGLVCRRMHRANPTLAPI